MNQTQSFSISLTYKFIFFFTFSTILSLIGVTAFIFHSFQRDLELIKKTVSQNSLEMANIIKKLTLENIDQAQKISKLEQEAIVSGKSFLSVGPLLNSSDNLRLIIFVSIAIISVIALYFTYNWFFQQTIFGKVIGFTNYYACKGFKTLTGTIGTNIKTYNVPFKEFDFDLKIIIDSDKICTISYKSGLDSMYIPFELFLEKYSNLSKFSDLHNAVKAGDISLITQAANTAIASEPTVLEGLGAMATIYGGQL